MGKVMVLDKVFVCDTFGSLDTQIKCIVLEKERLEKNGWEEMHLVVFQGDFYIEGRRPFVSNSNDYCDVVNIIEGI